MIRKIAILAVLRLLSAALTVGAASVTPASPTNYIFTTPLFPASIRGEVMGDPPAYYDPRGEDIDWLFEAYTERIALIYGTMPEKQDYQEASFGKWNLSETNSFRRWSTAVDSSFSTNIVVGYTLVTNAPRFSIDRQNVKEAFASMWNLFLVERLGHPTGEGSFRSEYIDAGAALLDTNSVRVAYDMPNVPSFTNIYYTVGLTNSIVTNVNYITRVVTNDLKITRNVFTNLWTAIFYHPVTNAVTNVVVAAPLDFCHDGDGPFPGFPNVTASANRFIDPWTLHDGVTSNLYAALRAAARLADTTSPTNEAEHVSESRDKYFNPDGSITYYSVGSTNWSVTAYYNISGENLPWTYEYDEYMQERYYYYHVNVSEGKTSQYEAIAPTRFKSDIVTTGGVSRVEIEAAFAIVSFSYNKDHEEQPGSSLVRDVSIYKIVVVPIPDYALDLSNQDAMARAQLDARHLCVAAASAAGAPSPPKYSEYEPPKGERHYWSAECSSIVLIYKIKPHSKITGW